MQFHAIMFMAPLLPASLYPEPRTSLRKVGAGVGLRGTLTALVCALIVGLICWNMRLLDVQLLLFIPALILTIIVAGYLRNTANETALWMFNARLALAVLTAIVVGVMFGAGLSAVVESLHYLFGTNIHSAHGYIWMTAATLISPVTGLSMVTGDLDEEFRLDGDKTLLVNSSLGSSTTG